MNIESTPWTKEALKNSTPSLRERQFLFLVGKNDDLSLKAIDLFIEKIDITKLISKGLISVNMQEVDKFINRDAHQAIKDKQIMLNQFTHSYGDVNTADSNDSKPIANSVNTTGNEPAYDDFVDISIIQSLLNNN